MKNPIIFVAPAISVRINVGTVDQDVVDVKHGALGESANNRLGHSFIKASRALDIHIPVTIINFNL